MEATRACPCWVWLIVAGLISIVAFVLLFVFVIPGDTFYSIAIDSSTGLDPPSPTDFSLARPEFNLTFRVTTNGLRRSVCVDAGIYAEVSYRCVPLAASPAMSHRFCVTPGKKSDEPMFARGARVRPPGYMMDNLGPTYGAGWRRSASRLGSPVVIEPARASRWRSAELGGSGTSPLDKI
ncbi:hypothetical protein ZWY2020_017999 [Hordeum vulgare]|nr:hypothetical protein ZWY2020_017999 [Hordeum vulgare]